MFPGSRVARGGLLLSALVAFALWTFHGLPPAHPQRLRLVQLSGRGLGLLAGQALVRSAFRIPNHVHFVLANRPPKYFEWTAYLAARAAIDRLQPSRVVYHLLEGREPYGEWWEATKALQVPHGNGIYGGIELVAFSENSVPRELNGHPVVKPEHISDFRRFQVLHDEGGIYMDTDHIVLRSYDALRRGYSTVWGRQINRQVAIGCILAEPHAPLIHTMYTEMLQRFDGSWCRHSVDMVDDLFNRHDFPEALVLGWPLMYPFGWDPQDLYETHQSLFQGNSFDFAFQKAYSRQPDPSEGGCVFSLHLFTSHLGQVMRRITCRDFVVPNTTFARAIHLAVDDVGDLCQKLEAFGTAPSARLQAQLWLERWLPNLADTL
eukprot:EG_transcript_10016